MKTIELYVKTDCPYSDGAKRLLTEKGLPFQEINISEHPERRAEMISRAGGAQTTPQAFFGGEHLGGFDRLQEIDRTEGLRTRANDEQASAASP